MLLLENHQIHGNINSPSCWAASHDPEGDYIPKTAYPPRTRFYYEPTCKSFLTKNFNIWCVQDVGDLVKKRNKQTTKQHIYQIGISDRSTCRGSVSTYESTILYPTLKVTPEKWCGISGTENWLAARSGLELCGWDDLYDISILFVRLHHRIKLQLALSRVKAQTCDFCTRWKLSVFKPRF